MNKYYRRERLHEEKILNRYLKDGYQGIRAAGSKGVIDLIVWNKDNIIFIASQSVPFTRYRLQEIRYNCPLPLNSRLLFIWKSGRKEIVLDSKDLDQYLINKNGNSEDVYIKNMKHLEYISNNYNVKITGKKKWQLDKYESQLDK